MKTQDPEGGPAFTILVVDDEPAQRSLLCRLLEARGYLTQEAENGRAALEVLSRRFPDLILLDLQMPIMDGVELLRLLKTDEKTQAVPAIILTGLTDRESRLTALRWGAADYLTKPVDDSELALRVGNQMRLKRYGDLLNDRATTLEKRVAERTVELSDSYRETILLLTSAAEFRDQDTGAHIRRVSHFTAEIARRMRMSADFVECIYYASPMHDIGKIAVPDRILYKPGTLDDPEWETMRNHTVYGKQILAKGKGEYVRMGAEIAVSHHEHWNGGGYPYGLTGENIPLSGCVMSVCDSYDALRSSRPYKQPYSHEYAVRAILEGDGRTDPRHFHPGVLAAFASAQERFREIYSTHAE